MRASPVPVGDPLGAAESVCGRSVQRQPDVDQVVSDHPQSDPAFHAVLAFVATAIEPMPALEQADASFASGTPALGLAEPALALEQPALRALAAGVYSVRGPATSANQDVVAVALHVPDAVFCLFTALEIHDIRAPGADIWVALPPGARKPKVADISIEAVYPSAQSLGFGVVPVTRDGVTLKVTDLAKTVADCFNFRRRVGLDVAIDALRAARLERGVSVDDLWRSAEAAGADGFMRPYLEVIG